MPFWRQRNAYVAFCMIYGSAGLVGLFGHQHKLSSRIKLVSAFALVPKPTFICLYSHAFVLQ